jgi:Glu-tRNA(Gln) amidotransferase subunit E-like FAD-binding protein
LISSLKDRNIIDMLDDEDEDLISGDVMTYSMIHSLISQHGDQIIKIHEQFKNKSKSIDNLPDIKIDGVVHNYLTLSIGTKIEKDYPEIIEKSPQEETNEIQPKSEIISLDDEEMQECIEID